MEAPPVTMMPVTGGTINMMEYLLQGKAGGKMGLISGHSGMLPGSSGNSQLPRTVPKSFQYLTF